MEQFQTFLTKLSYSENTIRQYASIINNYQEYLRIKNTKESIQQVSEFLANKTSDDKKQVICALKIYFVFRKSPILFELENEEYK